MTEYRSTMHVSDGVLSSPVLAAGFAGAVALGAWSMRAVENEEIPKISVVTAAFFVASLIHFPVPGAPFSLHLVLNGLAGVILGVRAFPAIFVGIILQALLFGHGGVSVIGVNTVMMGGGALAAYAVWRLHTRIQSPQRAAIFGALAGAVGIIVSGMILALALLTTGDAFVATAWAVVVYHIPLMLVEGTVAGACIAFLARVKPALLPAYQADHALHGSR